MKIHAILLAAGTSERMGRDKLLIKIRGERVLYRALLPLISSARINGLSLVVQPGFSWPDGPVACDLVVNPDFEEGMASSMRAGILAAPEDVDAYLIALADMPNLSVSTLHRLIDEFSRSDRGIARPSFRGKAGHPVLMARSFREELLSQRGDVGAREILRAHSEDVLDIPVDEPGVVEDLDHPGDFGGFPRILIKGAGEIASAVAHRFFTSGFEVMMTDVERPTTIRRLVAFATAIQEGEVEVEGVPARAFSLEESGELRDFRGRFIPVLIDPECETARRLRPEVIIDARLLKRNEGSFFDEAELVIALGPGFIAAEDVDLVIETNRGHDLARLIEQGPAQPNTHTPGTIAGHTADRVLRSPGDGIFDAASGIGDLVEAGQELGRVGELPVRTLISGVIRGLIHPGYVVRKGQKIGDVDPRGRVEFCSRISEKGRNIGGACLGAVMRHFHSRMR